MMMIGCHRIAGGCCALRATGGIGGLERRGRLSVEYSFKFYDEFTCAAGDCRKYSVRREGSA